MNPYLVLGVPRGSDDARIRQAYLAAIREATPESHPLRFKAVVAAYDKIKDAPSRHRFDLFDTECPATSPLDSLLRQARHGARPTPLPLDAMKDLLRACSKP